MDRRNFIKATTATIAALTLGVKSKAREIVTGVGRGSPRMMDSPGVKVRIGDYEFSDGDSMIIPVDSEKWVKVGADLAIPGAEKCTIVTVSNGKIVGRFDVPVRPIEFDWRKTDMREPIGFLSADDIAQFKVDNRNQ